MSTVEAIAIVTTAAATLAMAFLVLSRHFVLPLLMDIGLSMVALGFVSAIDTILSHGADPSANRVRWLLIGSGAALVALSVGIRLLFHKGPKKRISDWFPTQPTPLPDSDQKRVFGAGKSP